MWVPWHSFIIVIECVCVYVCVITQKSEVWVWCDGELLMAITQKGFPNLPSHLVCLVLFHLSRYTRFINYWCCKPHVHCTFMYASHFLMAPLIFSIKEGRLYEDGERGNLYLEKPIPSMGRKVIEHTQGEKVVTHVHSFCGYYFKEGLSIHRWIIL